MAIERNVHPGLADRTDRTRVQLQRVENDRHIQSGACPSQIERLSLP